MKFQFSTSFILLMTAFFGICVGGMLPFWRELGSGDKAHLPKILLLMGPILVPFLYAAYAMGRRTLTRGMVLVFAMAEVAATLVFWNLK